MRFALLLLLAIAPGVARADGMVVTSDTPQYCDSLARAVAAAHPPPLAAELLQAGRSMCTRGEIRGGIMRLRRALLMERGATAD